MNRRQVAAGSNDVKAAAAMTLGMMFIPLGDTFAKLASEATDYSGTTLAWARLLVGAMIAVPLAIATGRLGGLQASFVRAQVVRGAFFTGTIVCIITAVGMIPLADAFGAFFIGPAVATLLARLILAEPIGRIEWLAVTLGFIGVMMIVRPSVSMEQGQLWALAAGVFYGCYLTATRWAKSSGHPLAQLAGQLCVGTLLLTPFAVSEFASVGVQAPSLLLGSGLSSAIGNLLAITALGLARSALLAPLVYCQLVAATALGYAVFGHLPDAVAALGLALIVASGLSPLWRAPAR